MEINQYGANWWERLQQSATYIVAVQAVGGGQAGGWKNSASIGPLIGYLQDIQVTRADGSITISWKANWSATEYLVDCAVKGESYTRCANPASLDPNAARHSVTVNTWTAGGSNYSIDNSKVYDVRIASKNQWGTAHWVFAPWVRPYHDGGNADLFVTAVSATTATLSIKDYSGNYWYKADKGPDTTCRGFGGVDKVLTGLTVGETYTYSAHSAKGCDSNKLVATASAYTAGRVSVSNLTAASDGFGTKIHIANPHVTGFTTGANRGSYTLNSVTIKFIASSGNPGTLTVAVRKESDGDPADYPLYTLSGTAPTTAGEYTYTCSGGCSLDANTTYFLFATGDSLNEGASYFHADTTRSTNETNVPGNARWRIADKAKEYYNRNNIIWRDAADWTGIFKVSATPPPPSLTPSNLTQTGATLTIANHIGDWYYKYTSPSGGICSSAVSGDSATVTMSSGTTYTFAAYSDSSCSNLLATAITFSTAELPAAPTTPTAVATADKELSVSWQQPTWAAKYHVTYTCNNGGSWGGVANGSVDSEGNLSQTGQTVTATVDLSAGWWNNQNPACRMAVRAGNHNGWSSWVNSNSVTPQ